MLLNKAERISCLTHPTHMFNTPHTQSFCQHKASGIRFFLSGVAVLTCLLTMGCASSDKSGSFIPFFGGGTPVNSPENEFPPESLPMNPAQQVIVNDGPGPATPSTPVSSAVTSNPSNAYNPPEMLHVRNVPPASASPQDNMTMVYDIPPSMKTNSGGVAGSLSPAYSGYSGSTTGHGGASSSNYDYGYGRTPATGVGSDYGRTYPASSTSSSANDTRNDTKYGNESRYDGSSHGDSTPYNRFYHGPPTGHTSSLVPTGTRLEDGDYLANDGSMMRVINGKAYQMVQYFQPGSPVLPVFPDESRSQLSTQPPIPHSSTQIQISMDYRTATQMTDSFNKVPIPEYASLLDQQESGLYVASQGVVTVAVPATTTTIIPDSAPVETVPSLDYSEYSGIGAIKATASLGHGANGEVDEVMQRSIWSIMANQNHDLLLYPRKTK